MRSVKSFLVFFLLAAMLLSMGVFAFAETPTYTVRIFPGEQGTIDGSSDPLVVTVSSGSSYTFDITRADVNAGSKYYVKGIRVAGEDSLANLSFTVTEDVDYVIAYGMKGDMVQYTVKYVDAHSGKTLATSQKFYGNIGDKPIVAYKYINGYQPKFKNITKTLSADGEVFTFEYNPIVIVTPTPTPTPTPSPSPNGNTTQSGTNAQSGTNTQTGANAQAGANAPAGADQSAGSVGAGTQDGQASGEPEEILDLDTPAAAQNAQSAGTQNGSAQTGAETPSRSFAGPVIAGLAAALLVAGGTTAVVLKNKKKKD